MKRLTHVLAGGALLAALVMIWGPADVVSADHCTGSTQIGDDGGSVSAECHGGTPGQPTSTVGWSGADRYEFYCGEPFPGGEATVYVTDLGLASQEQVEAQGFDPTGVYAFYEVQCQGADGNFTIDWFFWGEVVPPVDPAVLRDRALARVTVPVPSVGSFPDGGRPALVQGDTWFWIEDPWDPLVETETQGFTTVSVSASPDRVEWRPGDGDVLVCHGPGDVWREGLYEQGSSCSHTYTASSADQPGDVYAGSATVFWELTWAINGSPQGSFGTVSQTSSFTMPAAEVQVVES